jgi:hypothetical protein
MTVRLAFETPQDLEKELSVAKKLEQSFQCKTEKNPKNYFIDFSCFRNEKLVAWLECRCRNNTSYKYPDYLLSAAKVVHGLQFSALAKVPFIFAVEFTDGIFWHSFKPIQYEIRYMRRSQNGEKWRNDPQDNEPCVVLNPNMLKRLNK